MEIIKKRIADMERAEYNPRVELMPGDDEYEKLKRNIDRFGVVVPVIWNKRTNRVVSCSPASHRAYERGRHRDGCLCC